MNDQQYLQYARERLAEFSRTLVLRSSHLPEDDPLRGLAQAFEAANLDTETLYAEVPLLINRLFTTYTDFAPTFPGTCCGSSGAIACISCRTRKLPCISNWTS